MFRISKAWLILFTQSLVLGKLVSYLVSGRNVYPGSARRPEWRQIRRVFTATDLNHVQQHSGYAVGFAELYYKTEHML